MEIANRNKVAKVKRIDLQILNTYDKKRNGTLELMRLSTMLDTDIVPLSGVIHTSELQAFISNYGSFFALNDNFFDDMYFDNDMIIFNNTEDHDYTTYYNIGIDKADYFRLISYEHEIRCLKVSPLISTHFEIEIYCRSN